MHLIFSCITSNGRKIYFLFMLKKYRFLISNKFKIVYNDRRKYISDFSSYVSLSRRIYLQVTIVLVSETSYDKGQQLFLALNLYATSTCFLYSQSLSSMYYKLRSFLKRV